MDPIPPVCLIPRMVLLQVARMGEVHLSTLTIYNISYDRDLLLFPLPPPPPPVRTFFPQRNSRLVGILLTFLPPPTSLCLPPTSSFCMSRAPGLIFSRTIVAVLHPCSFHPHSCSVRLFVFCRPLFFSIWVSTPSWPRPRDTPPPFPPRFTFFFIWCIFSRTFFILCPSCVRPPPPYAEHNLRDAFSLRVIPSFSA